MVPYFVKVFELYPPKSAWGGYVCYGEGKGTSGGRAGMSFPACARSQMEGSSVGG